MMIKPLLKTILFAGLCASSALYAASSDPSAHAGKACKNKKDGQEVSFSYKGVLYNGNCVQGDKGLVFQPPKPAEGNAEALQTDLTTAPMQQAAPSVDGQTPPPPPQGADGQTPPPPPPQGDEGQNPPPPPPADDQTPPPSAGSAE